MPENLYSLTFLIPTLIAIISIILNLWMFFSRRREKSNDKINDLVVEQKVLKTRIDFLEEPIKAIQKETLITFLQTNSGKPEKVLRKNEIEEK